MINEPEPLPLALARIEESLARIEAQDSPTRIEQWDWPKEVEFLLYRALAFLSVFVYGYIAGANGWWR